ncbi:hypothetical protein PUR49_10980 [Streptomyces sp. BE147]|uniref:hypothetical protein n=1 Tax=Streptomyces sp. BE147 TaxID=3002524 RepID=UPI002E7A914A|nr:hypothetical protein [Streptomyces sp. BE147]MEE1737019.1 hypothetical protein [Streptomyces sp. BE147]
MSANQAGTGGRSRPVWDRLRLSDRMRRLLLEGDTEGRYTGQTDSDTGYRLTMALAVGCSQPGRAWSPADFHHALIYTPSAGGVWARRLRERKGTLYAEAKLTAMLERAAALVAASPVIRGRDDAVEALGSIRRVVEGRTWPARRGADTDQKNLAARLRLCERAGGVEHVVSVRQLAELMNCAKATAEASDRRLKKDGWLVLVASGSGKDHGSRWVLRVPPDEEEVSGAQPGQLPATGSRGAGTVPTAHTGTSRTDTEALAALMGHDAFHRYAHGTSGARLLTCLDPVDGLDVAQLSRATGLHRTTVVRRMRGLVEDQLAVELDGKFLLASALSAPGRLHADQQVLSETAEHRGTAGLGERRRARHRRDRYNYRRWLAERAEQRHPRRPALELVPEGVLDPDTGELLDDAWAGWDVRDRARPVWRGAAPPGEGRGAAAGACA